MKKPIAVAASFILIIIVLSISIVTVYLTTSKTEVMPDTQNYTYTVVNTYPHDTSAFTEGLVYANGFLYESTGLNGFSTLRRVNLTSGDVLQEVSLPNQFFGEGIAIVNNTIIQLTYKSHIGFIYDKTSFALLGNFTYPTEGWGLTYDGKNLIMSDGSSNLYFLNPTTLQQVKQVHVHDGNVSVPMLNELEYINGTIYANIFEQQKIAIINPETGNVKAWINLSGLQGSASLGPEQVLNGIAYDPQGNRLFVTGKDWPHLYQIKLAPLK